MCSGALSKGDAQAAQRIAAVRSQLRLHFIVGVAPPTTEEEEEEEDAKVMVLNKSTFLTHLEKAKLRCKEDAKWEKSLAWTAIDADETAVEEFMDPMEEIRMSGEALRETYQRIEALQLMFRHEVFGTGGDNQR